MLAGTPAWAEDVKIIFVTKPDYTGNLVEEAEKLGAGPKNLNKHADLSPGIEAADYICEHDPYLLADGAYEPDKAYKAMIGDETRYGCDDTGCSDGHSKNWVLAADTEYYTYLYDDELNNPYDGEAAPFGKTDGQALLPFSSEITSQYEGYVWTGLSYDWKEFGKDCYQWTSGDDGDQGRMGDNYNHDENSDLISAK